MIWLLSLALLWFPLCAWGHHNAQHAPELLQQVRFTQRLHERIPLDIALRDEQGKAVQLGDYFDTRPVILTLAYYTCPNLCPLVLSGLVSTLRTLSFTAGKEFTVLTVSIDPGETPEQAAAQKTQYLQRYGREAGHGWHFLTGDAEAIRRLTEAVGFGYTYDTAQEQFVHASGLTVLTPAGVLARYFYGLEFAPRDLRLGLIEAAEHRIGSPIDQLLLYCYHYDPQTGQYSLVIMQVLRLAGIVTVLGLGAFMGLMFRRERVRPKADFGVRHAE
jgi:protein SCO1/2